MARVDVAVPCYQYGRFLRDCVASILSQDLRDVRVLIIDNASTDDSLAVARMLAADPRIEIVAHPRNLGPHASFNRGIEWAESEYFMVLCADDMLLPGALSRAVAIMDRHPEIGLAYGRSALVFGEDHPTGEEGLSREQSWRVLAGTALLERFCRTGICHIAGCTAVVRTAVQKRVGYYRPELPHTDDFELWMRFAVQGAVAETDTLQGLLRVHGENRSAPVHQDHSRDIVHCEAAFESFFAKEGAELPGAAALHRMARHSLGARAYWSALSHLSRGHLGPGRSLMRHATRLSPSTAVLPPVGYLFHRDDLASRLAQIGGEIIRWSRTPIRPVRADG